MGEPVKDPTVEQAERLARLAAERAASLARDDAEKQTKLAVDRAVKDANIQRDLLEHSAQLRQINGSQTAMATALETQSVALRKLAADFARQTVAQETLAQAAGVAGARAFTRLQTIGILITAALATGGFLLAINTALTHG